MQPDKVAAVMARVTGDVPKESLPALQDMLANAPDAAFASLSSVSLKSTPVTVSLAFFLGWLGVDRFYIGDIGLGVAKLLLGWLTSGIWPLVDIFVSYRKARQKNFENISLILSGAGVSYAPAGPAPAAGYAPGPAPGPAPGYAPVPEKSGRESEVVDLTEE